MGFDRDKFLKNLGAAGVVLMFASSVLMFAGSLIEFRRKCTEDSDDDTVDAEDLLEDCNGTGCCECSCCHDCEQQDVSFVGDSDEDERVAELAELFSILDLPVGEFISCEMGGFEDGIV